MKKEFLQRIDSHEVHKQLARRKKKNDETYEYCYRMLKIASQAKVELSAIIQYIIDGISDDEVNKIVLYGARNISELKRKFNIYGTMKNKSKLNFKSDDKKKKTRAELDEFEGKRCFNCGGKNHVSAACPIKEKGIKCFKCEQYGHIASKCSTAENTKMTEKNKTYNMAQDRKSVV